VVKSLAITAILITALPNARAGASPAPDPDTAQRLSVAGSVAPLALLGIGLVAAAGSNNAIRDFGAVTAMSGVMLGIVTPSLGHFYSHEYLDPAIALRAGGVLIELVGLVRATNSEIGDCQSGVPCHLQSSTYFLLGAGIAMYLGGMALDIAWKPAHGEFQITPTALRVRTSVVPGVAATLRF